MGLWVEVILRVSLEVILRKLLRQSRGAPARGWIGPQWLGGRRSQGHQTVDRREQLIAVPVCSNFACEQLVS